MNKEKKEKMGYVFIGFVSGIFSAVAMMINYALGLGFFLLFIIYNIKFFTE